MQCLWPSRSTTWVAILTVAALMATAYADVPSFSRPSVSSLPLTTREQTLRRTPAHSSEFAPVYRASAPPSCAQLRPPEALLTPDPVMQDLSDDLLVRVSFIIGPDGRVHSAFVLNSYGRAQDDEIMQAIRRWRYRPGLCNGVPTATEAQVSFVPR